MWNLFVFVWMQTHWLSWRFNGLHNYTKQSTKLNFFKFQFSKQKIGTHQRRWYRSCLTNHEPSSVDSGVNCKVTQLFSKYLKFLLFTFNSSRFLAKFLNLNYILYRRLIIRIPLVTLLPSGGSGAAECWRGDAGARNVHYSSSDFRVLGDFCERNRRKGINNFVVI